MKNKRTVTTPLLTFRALVISGLALYFSTLALADNQTLENKMSENIEYKLISGEFSVDLSPQADTSSPAGRMLIDKTYFGALSGSGIGQMISKRTEEGASVYFAIEEFDGSLNGAQGTFTLTHKGLMSAEGLSLEVEILAGSGSGELQDISGSMTIIQKDGKHFYELSYKLP